MSPPDRIEALIEAGDYRAAAEICEARGMYARAQDLYASLFDYVHAGQMAEALGDHIGAIELFLKGNHLEEAESMRRRLMAELSDDIHAALTLFEQRSYFLQAAELAESIGNFAQAARLYMEGSSFGRAGKLFERIGAFRKAGEAYEAFLRGKPSDPVSNLGLGRVLQRFGRHREAIPLLSRALGDVKTADESARRIGYSFFKLGYLEAGRHALAKVGLPRTLQPERFMRPFEEEMLHGGAEEGGGADLQGRYRVERPLAGRQGVCYLGRDLLRDAPIVLRFVPGTAEANAAFYEELSRLKSPPIPGAVRVLEVNPEAGFVATEHVEGKTLLQLLQSDAPPTARRCRGFTVQLFETLRKAHQRGLLHGALTPRSIIVGPGDVCRVGDWGMVHVERRMATQTGGPESAFAYRAPELNIGRQGDFTSDLYAAAALLYRALTGSPPRMGHVSAGLAGWPAPFEAFFERALAADPGDRHPSHDLFKRQLAALPWHEVADRAAPRPERHDIAEAESRGPRFAVDGELLPGVPTTARDALLQRDVRLLLLPEETERPMQLVDRLHALSSPECPVFQDILRFDADPDAIVMEVLQGVPLKEYVKERGTVELHTLLEAAEALLFALVATHAAGIGLGTFRPNAVLFDGVGFRLPIEGALLVDVDHNAAAVRRDAAAFWGLLYLALSGREPPDPGPTRFVSLLRAGGHIAARDFEHLVDQIPTNANALAGLDEWFGDVVRAIEAHATRKRVFKRLEGLALADHVLNEAERAYLEARRVELGLAAPEAPPPE